MKAFKAGGCGSKEDCNPKHPASGQRDISCVVTRLILLLVGGVVFFVDHDKAKTGEGSEDRRPRADDDVGRPALDATPLIQPLAR